MALHFEPSDQQPNVLSQWKSREVTIRSPPVQFISLTARTCTSSPNPNQLPIKRGQEFYRLLRLRMCAVILLLLHKCYFLHQAQWYVYVTFEIESTTSKHPRCVLTFWRRIYFLILAHPVYKMWIIQKPNTLELWNKLHFEEKKRRVYIMFKIFGTYICWINI